MFRSTSRARIAAAVSLAGAAVLAVQAAPGTAGESPGTAQVHGAAQVRYAYSPDDDIRFRFDARVTPFAGDSGLPGDAVGTVSFLHRVAAVDERQWAVGEVDCLLTGDRTATFTAVITRASDGVQDWVGRRVGFSVYDGPDGHDRVGFSWGPVAVENAGGCMAPAPFAPVVSGGFAVHHAELPPLPEPGRTTASEPAN